MMAFLLATPTWLKVTLGALLLVGILQFQHWRTVRNLNEQLDNITAQLEQERINTANLKAGIERQNAAVRSLQARTRQLSAESALNANRALQLGDAVSSLLRSEKTDVPSGPKGMNDWLGKVFPKETK